MISHKTLGHPATLFALGVMSFIVGLLGARLIGDAVKADKAVAGPDAAAERMVSGSGVSQSVFVGAWRQEWEIPSSELWIHDTYVNGAPRVSLSDGGAVWNENYEYGVLRFSLRPLDSHTQYAYTVRLNPGDTDTLDLEIRPVNTNTYYYGKLVRIRDRPPGPPPLGDSYAAAPPAQEAETDSVREEAAGDFQPFLGTWTSRWADVTDVGGFTISIENGGPRVTRTGDWHVSDESFDGRVLSFYTIGGSSNWSFRYYLEPAGRGRLDLRVHRLHDNQWFTGEFTK